MACEFYVECDYDITDNDVYIVVACDTHAEKLGKISVTEYEYEERAPIIRQMIELHGEVLGG